MLKHNGFSVKSFISYDLGWPCPCCVIIPSFSGDDSLSNSNGKEDWEKKVKANDLEKKNNPGKDWIQNTRRLEIKKMKAKTTP